MAECPSCGGAGFVNSRTEGMGEAACLTDHCPIVVFEVREEGGR